MPAAIANHTIHSDSENSPTGRGVFCFFCYTYVKSMIFIRHTCGWVATVLFTALHVFDAAGFGWVILSILPCSLQTLQNKEITFGYAIHSPESFIH